MKPVTLKIRSRLENTCESFDGTARILNERAEFEDFTGAGLRGIGKLSSSKIRGFFGVNRLDASGRKFEIIPIKQGIERKQT
jgi:hypothetical protein